MSIRRHCKNRQLYYVALLSGLLTQAGILHPAHSAPYPFAGHGTPMRQDDMDALTEATNRLLDRPHLVPGDKATWSNQASGASGTITAGKQVSRHNLSCRILQHRVLGPGARSGRTYTTTWCKAPDGWKLG